uniref:HMG box domain-containing protein n=1 Tax=Syphacia muris TaxID=451379 RepID=A0A0N5AGV8_9BILA
MAPKAEGRKKKDPNAPKQPLSAYFLWLSENRERIKTEHPDAKITEISKIAGAEWGQITDKTRWEEMAKKEKERYQREMTAYEQSKQQ